MQQKRKEFSINNNIDEITTDTTATPPPLKKKKSNSFSSPPVESHEEEVVSDRSSNDDEAVKIILVDFALNNCEESILTNNYKLLKKKFETISKSTIKWIYNKSTINEQFIPIEFCDDFDYVKRSVSFDGELLKYASYPLKCDKEIVRIACAQTDTALLYAADELRNDKEFILEWIAKTRDGKIYEFASTDLKRDVQFTLDCIKLNGYVIKLVPMSLRIPPFFKQAVFQGGNNIEYVCGYALGYAPDLGNDREFVLRAVRYCGDILQHASPEFQNDKEIVLLAVSKSGNSLYFASDALKSDREFVLECVKRQGSSLSFASPTLLMEKSFVEQCIELNGLALEMARLQAISFDLSFYNQVLQTQGFVSPTYFRSTGKTQMRMEYEYPELPFSFVTNKK